MVKAKKRPSPERAVERTRARVPINLTAEDEQLMREDWGLNPKTLTHVRIYQELTKQLRQNNDLRHQVATLTHRLENPDAEALSEASLERALANHQAREAPKPTARIRRMSRPATVWPSTLWPHEVLLAVERHNGVEYAFIAADQIAADWALGAMPRNPELQFEWMLNQSLATERTP